MVMPTDSFAPSSPRRISLNDSHWFIGGVAPQPFGKVNDFDRVEGWLPATVPGDVRLDLMALGKLPDPFLGNNNAASAWVDDLDWWYRREIDLAADALLPGEDGRLFVVFEGIDYQSAIFWDGVELGRHVGMFSRQTYEIPRAQLDGARHRLAVRVWGGNQLPRAHLKLRERAWAGVAGRFIPHAAHTAEFPARYATLKLPMSFGWDFAPRILTCGIWDEAWLVRTRRARLTNVWVQGLPDGRVRVRFTLDGSTSADSTVRLSVRGLNFDDVQTFEFPLGDSAPEFEFSFELKNPRVWNPWDRGEPNLYRLETTLLDATGALDIHSTTFGLRTIDLLPNPGAPADAAPWTFTVNDAPEFIRGANWVPADAFPARVTRADYAELIGMARDANLNLLRVWGGGLAEKEAFYEMCDERGILVWQEFPLAGAGLDYFPRDRAFRELLAQESRAIVERLRNHPSVVLWCGGNEFLPSANRALVDTLRTTVAQADGTRPFKPASPSQDESHNWRVWHGYANTRDYEKDSALFFGEFGLQAVPNVETLARFMPDDALYPPNELWSVHNGELEKLWRYAAPLLPVEGDDAVTLEQFVEASQLAQLRGLQIAIEYARREKPRVSGCLFWQFNEPWYSICWSVLDYARRPKRAYAKIKELYNPVLAAFAYPLRPRGSGEIVSGQVWLVNDLRHAVSGTLQGWFNGMSVIELNVEIGADRALAVRTLDLALASGSNELRLEFTGDDVHSTNEYDLSYCDVGEINTRRALLTRGAAWLRTRT